MWQGLRRRLKGLKPTVLESANYCQGQHMQRDARDINRFWGRVEREKEERQLKIQWLSFQANLRFFHKRGESGRKALWEDQVADLETTFLSWPTTSIWRWSVAVQLWFRGFRTLLLILWGLPGGDTLLQQFVSLNTIEHTLLAFHLLKLGRKI